MKEKLYIGEATVATIAGLILGPHCLDWFDPASWGNSDEITLEICRIVLCIQIVAVAVELPRKYMKKHWLSVAILLLPVMTCGWIVVGLFIWILIPHFDFPSALLVAACVTATDPVLAAAVVGKGKFAERVPGHLRNLLTAESGCNDGMAFPFIYLSLGLIIHKGHAGEIVKDWFTLTILWECFFGTLLGVFLGYTLRKAVAFAEKKNLIDRESFLALFVFLAFNSAGIGSMLGVDDLLVSFAAGTAFGWNGDFARKTEESHVSTVIDLLLNLTFFVYFGAIVPWADFDNTILGLDVWRLVVLAVVVIFLRRIPAVLALKPVTPDIKSWREALFCGHFGPIGVGAIFAAILARKDLEDHFTEEETPLRHIDPSFPHYQLIYSIWPIICFIVITSIVVHGSSVAVLTLGKRLNRMAITMSFTVTNTQDQGPSWMSRLQKLEKTSTSFSLHRIDTSIPDDEEKEHMPRTNTIETSGVKVRPAGGARRKRHRKRTRRANPVSGQELDLGGGNTERQRPQPEILQLGRVALSRPDVDDSPGSTTVTGSEASKILDIHPNVPQDAVEEIKRKVSKKLEVGEDLSNIHATVYQEGLQVIIEDQQGEILETMSIDKAPTRKSSDSRLDMSIHSMDSLRRNMSQFSILSDTSLRSQDDMESLGQRLSRTLSGHKKAIVKKGTKKKYFAHQVDDLLVIENEDGEIVRRYRVNRHNDQAKSRSRSGTIVSRALSLVGIKTKDSQLSNTTTPVLTRRASLPVSEEAGSSLLSPPSASNQSPMGPSAGVRNPSVVYEELDDLFDVTDSDDTESLPDETEVEKRRRLAALGEIPGERGASDEED